MPYWINGTLDQNSSVYRAPHGNGSQNFYIPLILTVRVNGVYQIRSESTVDLYGYLYNRAFNFTDPYWNLITFDDNGAGNSQFLISQMLNIGKYVLVVTTKPSQTAAIFRVRFERI